MKIACLQMNSGNDVVANIRSFQWLMEKAIEARAQLVATPENTFLMEEPGKPRPLYREKEHPGVQAAAEAARKHTVWLLLGSVHVLPDDAKADEEGKQKTYNRSILFTPEGHVAARYDKIHLFDVEVGDGQVYRESARILCGGKAVTAELPAGRLGLSICYDVRFPHLYRQLAQKGAEILAAPAAFTQVTGEAHWHVLLRARAIENGCFVIAPAQTGTHPGSRKTFGHSLIIDPWGRVLADAGTEPGVITVELDMAQIQKVRSSIPSLQHDRAFTC